MNQHSFTAALVEQHRADLMASAQHARDCRRANPPRRGTPKLRSWPTPGHITWPISRRLGQLRESF
jgi:hypothetical protein